MAYGSIARGYKSGGFNVRGEANLPNMGFVPFDPETALTYEVGLRSGGCIAACASTSLCSIPSTRTFSCAS